MGVGPQWSLQSFALAKGPLNYKEEFLITRENHWHLNCFKRLPCNLTVNDTKVLLSNNIIWRLFLDH